MPIMMPFWTLPYAVHPAMAPPILTQMPERLLKFAVHCCTLLPIVARIPYKLLLEDEQLRSVQELSVVNPEPPLRYAEQSLITQIEPATKPFAVLLPEDEPMITHPASHTMPLPVLYVAVQSRMVPPRPI